MEKNEKKIGYVIGSYNPGSLSKSETDALIDNLIQLGEGEESNMSIENVVESFGVAKTQMGFMQDLYSILSIEHKNSRQRNIILSNICETIKENELHKHLVTITKKEETLYHSIQEIKKFICQYYEMIFKYVESEALKKNDTQSHLIESIFNREDPLFWIALFLYQKELNTSEKFLRNIRSETSQKRKLYTFLQDDNTLEAIGNEKRFEELIKDFFLLLDHITPHISEYRTMNSQQVQDIGKNLEKEVERKTQVADALSKEHNPFEKFFASTREYAKTICSNVEMMHKIRKNLSSMAAKFNTKEMNPLHKNKELIGQISLLLNFMQSQKNDVRRVIYEKFKQDNNIQLHEYDRYFETGICKNTEVIKALQGDKKIHLSDIGMEKLIADELQFIQTMTWFGNNTYAPHFVKNINLAGYNLGIPRTATLKGRLDRICGTLKNQRVQFVFVSPSMNTQNLLLTNKDETLDNDNTYANDNNIYVQETANKLFDDLLNDDG